MDVLTGGLNQGNLVVTSVLLIGLVLVSGKAKMLERFEIANVIPC